VAPRRRNSRDPAHRKVGTLPVDIRRLAHPTHPSTEEGPCACYEGVVYIGHLVEEDGEGIEVVEAMPCPRCAAFFML